MENKRQEIIILDDSNDESKKRTLPLKVRKRKPGSAKGMITITDDFHKPLNEDEIQDFYK